MNGIFFTAHGTVLARDMLHIINYIMIKIYRESDDSRCKNIHANAKLKFVWVEFKNVRFDICGGKKKEEIRFVNDSSSEWDVKIYDEKKGE